MAECIKFCDDNPGCDYFRYYPDEIKNCRPREGLFVGERTHDSEATAFYRSCDMGNKDNDNIHDTIQFCIICFSFRMLMFIYSLAL